jgi:hypothetical protein
MYKPEYELAIDTVEVQERGTNVVSSGVLTKPGELGFCEDEWLSWDWDIGARKLGVTIQNRAATPVLVKWNLATFTAIDGATDRLIDHDVSFEDRSLPKHPVELEPGSSVEESLYPSNFLYWKKKKIVNWRCMALVPQMPGIAASEPAKAEEFARRQIGKGLRIMVPVEHGGESRSYTFVLVIKSYDIQRFLGT